MASVTVCRDAEGIPCRIIVRTDQGGITTYHRQVGEHNAIKGAWWQKWSSVKIDGQEWLTGQMVDLPDTTIRQRFWSWFGLPQPGEDQE